MNICHGSKNMNEATKYSKYVDDSETNKSLNSWFWKILLNENLPPLSANSFVTDLTEIKIAANNRYLPRG